MVIPADHPSHMDEFLSRLRASAFGDVTSASPGDEDVQVQGWVNAGFEECLERVASHVSDMTGSRDAVFIEVGTWKGASAVRIAETLKTRGVLKWLVCVDTWLGSPEFYTWGLDDPTRGVSLNTVAGFPTVFQTFTRNVRALGHTDVVVPFPMSSAQAAEVLAYYRTKAHAAYIDASHEYDAVIADLRAYRPLMHDGGVMWGDDWDWPGVRTAVEEFARAQGLEVRVVQNNWLLFV